MIESQRKRNGHHEQDCENRRIAKVREREAREISNKNEDFRGDDVRHDSADKKTFLAFENRITIIALVFQVKRSPYDRVATAHWTLKPQTAHQCELDTAGVAFHVQLSQSHPR